MYVNILKMFSDLFNVAHDISRIIYEFSNFISDKFLSIKSQRLTEVNIFISIDQTYVSQRKFIPPLLQV